MDAVREDVRETGTEEEDIRDWEKLSISTLNSFVG